MSAREESPFAFAEHTYEEIEALPRGRWVALLPVGATEAHGPHLPLSTDVIIAEGVAEESVRRWRDAGGVARRLPPIAYSVTDCAAEFAGTITIARSTARAVIRDVAISLGRHGAAALCLVNAHLEPEHRASLLDVVKATDLELPVLFPDIVRRRFASRLGAEFQSGACHAGRYETSLMLALRPELVRRELMEALDENPRSIGQALAEGKRTFQEAGGPRAYFGAPAAATAAEGRERIAELADIVVEILGEALGSPGAPG